MCLTEPLTLSSLLSVPKEAASGGPESTSIPFFAFSLIEGYISIVMDAETQKKCVTPSSRLRRAASGKVDLGCRVLSLAGHALGIRLDGGAWGASPITHLPPQVPQ